MELGAGEALAVVVHLLDLVLDEDVQPQRPLAVLTHVDEPLLEHPVLVVGHLVLVDDAGESVQQVLVDRRRALDRGIGRDPLGLELVGRSIAGPVGGGGSPWWSWLSS